MQVQSVYSAVEPEVKIDSLHFSERLTDKVAVYEDVTSIATIEDVLALPPQRFSYFTGSSLNLDYSDSAFWFRIRLHNQLKRTVSAMLITEYPLLDNLDYYYVDQHGVINRHKLGDRVVLSQREFPLLDFTGDVPLNPDERQTIFIRVQSQSILSVPLYVTSHATLPVFFSSKEWINGAYFGLGFAMLVYNFLLWLKIRERIYLEYVFCVFCQIGFVASFSGYSAWFFPGNQLLGDKGHFLIVAPMMVGFLQFTRSFLKLKETYPLIDRLFRYYMVVPLLLIPVDLMLPTNIVSKLNMFMILLSVAMIFTISLKRFLEGYVSAYYFLFGDTIFMASILFGVLATLDVLPWFYLSPLVIKIGSAFEMMMFSMSLASRIDELKSDRIRLEQEQERAQEKTIATNEYIRNMSEVNKELERALQVRSEFLANVSHEIRTPMNGILGMLELIESPQMDSVQRNYLDIARRSGRTLLELINDVLELSKIESGEFTLDKQCFSLRAFCNDLSSLYLRKAQDKHLDLIVRVDSSVPDDFTCDRVRLWQVMTNLISNAIKFTNSGKVVLKVHFQRQEGNRICFCISDTGIGIADEKQELIFETFKQADGTTTREYGGTGLGLSISQKLVAVMGGDLKLRSSKGKGSDFFFSLPYVLPEAAPQPEQVKLPETAEINMSQVSEPITLLLVEDNPVNQKVALGMLKKMGLENPLVAENGADALKLYSNHSVDLVLMDIQMPEMDGYETTQCIRQLEADQSHVPIIAMTANAMDGDREKCLQAGMDDYLSKPVKIEQLREILTKYGSDGDKLGAQQAV